MATNPDNLLLEDGLALSTGELSYLERILSHGDRVGFYGVYQAITSGLQEGGATEAALQAKIASFSDDVGGTAFLSNAVIQEALGPEQYPGIYLLSQAVATSALNAMKEDAGLPNTQTRASDGLLNDSEFYRSAEDAWRQAEARIFFPGNLLTEVFEDFNAITVSDTLLTILVEIAASNRERRSFESTLRQ